MFSNYYISDDKAWMAGIESVTELEGPAQAPTYVNACILPPRKIEDINEFNAVYEGGVCDEDYNFIAGRLRSLTNSFANWSCSRSYVPDEEPTYRDESVIFGGVLFRHIGHALLDTTARLWYLARNKQEDRKIVFLEYDWQFAEPFDGFVFTDLMGISRDRIEIIQNPTKFREVTVPDEGAFPLSADFRKEYIEVFNAIRDNVPASSCKRVYLTRSAFAKNDCINEKYYEDFFRRRGFKVISPETLSVSDQIALVKGADEFVASVGTMTHLLLFARPEIKATILNRSADCVLPQLLVDKIRGIEPYYVEAVRNVLPTRHTAGIFLFAPNRFFKKYLDDTATLYDSEELVAEDLPEMVFEYLGRWSSLYSKEYGNTLKKYSMADVLFSVQSAVLDSDSDRKLQSAADGIGAVKAQNAKLRKKIKKLTAKNEKLKVQYAKSKDENERLKKRLEDIRASKSWKMARALAKLSHFGK